MAEFTGEKERTIRIQRPLDEVFEKFTDLEVRARCMPNLERHEKLDEGTCRWIMKEENEKGIRFTPDYTVKYENNGHDRFSWQTLSGNPRSSGHGSCRSLGEEETEVRFYETITVDIPVPRLIAPFIRGLVAKKLAAGVDHYLEGVARQLDPRFRF